MNRLLTRAGAATLLVACATSWAGAGSVVSGAAEGAVSPARCTTFSIGNETHTGCDPAVSAPPGSAIVCHNYTVGADTHVECTGVPALRLSGSRERNLGPTLPAPSLRCYTYHIGSSAYTDCR